MKKFFAFMLLFASVAFVGAACNTTPAPLEPPAPLTQADCFKEVIPYNCFKFSYKPQGYELEIYDGEYIAFSEFEKSNNDIEPKRYNNFQICTTEKASQIEVISISFDVVFETSCNVGFCLWLDGDSSIYSDTVVASSGTPATITWTNLHKRWSEEEAGKSEMREGWLMGEAYTFLKIELLGQGSFIDNSYSVQNLKIEFTEL